MSNVPAILCVGASIYAMIFLGMVNILLLYAMWLPRFIRKSCWPFRDIRQVLLPGAIALYSMASVIWSAHPDVTLRAAVQFTSVMLCALVISRIVRFNAVLMGVTLGMCVSLAIVVINAGGIHPDSPLVGGLGSKNQVGANAEIGAYCALLLLFEYKSTIRRVVLGVPTLAFCLLCLHLSRSATSIVTFCAMVGVSAVVWSLANIPTRFRIMAYLLAAYVLVVAATLSLAVDVTDVGLSATGKDATLTGRTYLWGEGIKAGMENPILGVGVGAFWVVGTPVAEAIWYKFGINNRSGFHFHNLFINLFVEVGAIGALLWIACYASTCFRSYRNLQANGRSVESVWFLGMACMYLMRSFTESDTPGPYGTGPLLFFYVVMSVSSRTRRKRSEKGDHRLTIATKPSLKPLSRSKPK